MNSILRSVPLLGLPVALAFWLSLPAPGFADSAADTKPSAAAQVVSADGTAIAYELRGQGPLLIIAPHALSTKEDSAALAELLAPQFTVLTYDRRGRGGSGDTQPYSPQRELEDIEALIDANGGSAYLFGGSSGAVLALEAASRLPQKVARAVLFEPPFVVDDSRPPVPADFSRHVAQLIQAGDRSAAVAYFMTDAVLVPAEYVEQMKSSPMWPAMESLAHTLIYEVELMGHTQAGEALPAERWSGAGIPVLVLAGGASEPWLQNAARALSDLLPQSSLKTLPELDHSAMYSAPNLLAPVIAGFLGDAGVASEPQTN